MSRTIKRYGNRKLYDTQESRYVTLEDISGFVKAGEDVRVVDNDSGEDLTAVTFAQIILEEERKKNGFVPVPTLRRMIQQGEQALQGIVEKVDKGMESGKKMIDDIIASPQKRLESLQHRIDERVEEAVDRLKALPADLQRQLTRIEKSIREFEVRLAKIRGVEKPEDEKKEPPAA
jgi:polyhydroxyalkanoate synthesis repressor PhaR